MIDTDEKAKEENNDNRYCSKKETKLDFVGVFDIS